MPKTSDRKCGKCKRMSIRLDVKSYKIHTYCWHKKKWVTNITPACESNNDFKEVSPVMGGAGTVKNKHWPMPEQRHGGTHKTEERTG